MFTGLEITGKQQDELNKWCKDNIDTRDELFALFDYDKSGTKKEWRCYSKESLNAEETAYDPEKQSIKYYTRNTELMNLLGRCRYPLTLDPNIEIKEVCTSGSK